ncbi:hypothetical protein [Cellulomonas sp. PhB143]|uniref:hypothetical protein n=1 Tax=Cellulomonas sp. PhB143 TaxID=2485186 RepID=UPI0011CD9B24|nr:hypothetical protein [Cellulomonas sp. PhB143]
MAGTWLMCENDRTWRDTFRLEDLAYARDRIDDFETYRPDGVFESGTAWVALVVAFVAMTLAAVAGVCAGRWRRTSTAISTACLMILVATGAVLPFGPFILLMCALPATLAVRSLSRSPKERSGADAGYGASNCDEPSVQD